MGGNWRSELDGHLEAALAGVAGAEALGGLARERWAFGPAKSAEFGDLATSGAMMLAKPLRKNPMELAEEIARRLAESPLVAKAEAAKPGFVNVRLSSAALGAVLAEIAAKGERFGHAEANGKRVLLEFVSANPTGPMHLGHCRHAAAGDAMARLLRAAGWAVTTEFYINDAGEQIRHLGRSFRYRCLELLGALDAAEVEINDETDDEGNTREAIYHQGAKLQYTGDYVTEVAKAFVMDTALELGEADSAHLYQGPKTREKIEGMALEELAWEARNLNLESIKRDLAALGIAFDHYASEKALYDSGAVAGTLEALKRAGATYEQDGAVWLRTTDKGDDKDRVLVKKDGDFTYLVPDVAYHHDKFQRGFDRYINIFGADHGGYPPRLKAGISFLGHDASKLDVRLLRLVFLTRNGERVKFSKRAGNFVALGDVVEEAGNDAVRWFMLWRSLDTEFDFEIELAKRRDNDNPVFKVQYAHARICTLEGKAATAFGTPAATDFAAAAAHLTHPLEREMVLFLAQLPGVVERSAADLSLHHVPTYALALADLWNSYYTLAKSDPSFRILQDADAGRRNARLALAAAIRRVLANALELLGIAAPTHMEQRGAEEDGGE